LAERIHRNSLKAEHRLHWYVIERVLGQGGFGITYLAHDNNLDHKVAIKEYLPMELAVREGDDSVYPATEKQGERFQWGLERFINEARTLAKFKHPAIVRVLSVFEANNTAYMVMEYESGEPLQDILTRRKTMEEGELMQIIIPILGGLREIHQRGFIHRDIKPANILLRDDRSPVLLDFGSARQALGQETRTLTSVVSPGFAPFEQYYSKSDKQGPWTDIYGLGATLYRAVAGRAPMDAIDRSEALLKAERDIFVPAEDIGAGRYSTRFLKAIDRALKFREKERPQSVDEWLEAFGVPAELSLTREFTATVDTAIAGDERTRFDMPELTLDDPPAAGEGPPSEPSMPVAAPASAPPSRSPPSGEVPQHPAALQGPASAPPSGPYTGAPPRGQWLSGLVGGLFAALLIAGAFGAYHNRAAVMGFAEDLVASVLREPRTTGAARPPAARPEEIEARMKADAERDARRIRALLDSAKLAASDARITKPAGNSAASKYREVLAIDPANEAARRGLAGLVKTLASQAGEAAAHEDFDEALALLGEAERLDPDSAQIAFVREQVRAQQARHEAAAAQARRLAGLLAEAEAARAEGHYALPEDGSALAAYRQVLAIEANNATAEAGMRAMVETLVARANAAIDRKDAAAARKALDEAAQIKPDAGAIALARERIGEARARDDAARRRAAELRELLRKAEADLEALRLASPAGDNALDRYREVLRLDPGNSQARSGVRKVVGEFVALARQAMANGDFEDAKDYLASAQEIDPEAENVRMASDALQAKLAERDRERRAEAQRKAEAARRAAEQDKRRRLAEEMQRLLAGTPGGGAGEPQAAAGPPSIAVSFDGFHPRYARYGVSESKLRRRVENALRAAGYRVVSAGEALARSNGRLMEVYMRANENQTTGMFSYAVQVGVKERVALDSGGAVFGDGHAWKDGEGGAVRASGLSRLNEIVDGYVRGFLQRYPARR